MEKAAPKAAKDMEIRVIKEKIRAAGIGRTVQTLTEATFWGYSAATVTTGVQAIHCRLEYRRTWLGGSLFLRVLPRSWMADCWAGCHITTATNGSRLEPI